MRKEIKWKAYKEEDDSMSEFGTMTQIQEWMKENNIPDDAKLVYAGCGSHNIAFEWEVEIPEEMDTMRYDGQQPKEMTYEEASEFTFGSG